MFFLNSNSRQIRKSLKDRKRSYWNNVDAFGRHPSPPDESLRIPVVICEGVIYIDVCTSFSIDHDQLKKKAEFFSNIIRKFSNSTGEQVRGSIESIRGNFAVITTSLPDVHSKPLFTQVHTNELVLIRAY